MNLKSSSKIRLIIFLVSAALICYGVESGELEIIFAKATRICLECIGLG